MDSGLLLECASKAAQLHRTPVTGDIRAFAGTWAPVPHAPRRRRFRLATTPGLGTDGLPNPKQRRAGVPWQPCGQGRHP